MTLEQLVKEAVERDGLCDLTVRVSRYASLSAAIDEPAAWQAVAKYRGAEGGPWGVAVRSTPEAAIRAALTDRTRTMPRDPEAVDGGVFG